MPPLAETWRMDAATEYLATLHSRGLRLGLADGKLSIPEGHTRAEVELVRLLKPELIALLEQDDLDLREERAGILEYQAGMRRDEAEQRAGMTQNWARGA